MADTDELAGTIPPETYRRGVDAHGRHYEVRPGPHGGMTARALPSPHATAQKLRFLDAFCECGNAVEAAAAAGVDRTTFYRWAKADEAFREAWDIAIRHLVHRGAGTLYQRGLTEKGMPGVVAMLAWLKAHDPEHWVEKYQQPSGGGQSELQVTMSRVADLMQAALEARRAPALPPPAAEEPE